ncbi:hypothetical protein [Bacillus sp. FJAT-18017]|uniref:hypothetical protein n=1 Tax=Bacillus sp. FJAT-18017 TaxID=1705566 RepID=UPI0018D0AFD2|nr:hypothetical protein [Bacillus sp. FJAT-18017]
MLKKLLKMLMKSKMHKPYYSSSDAWKHMKHKKHGHYGHGYYKHSYKKKSFSSFFSS